MSHQPVPKVAQTSITFRQAGGSGVPLTIDTYFEQNISWLQGAIDLHNGVQVQAVIDNLLALVPPDYELVEVHTRDLEAEFAPARTATPNAAGTNASTLYAPVSVSAVVFWLATSPPPRRTFVHWPFVKDADVDTEGQLTSTFMGDLQLAFDGYVGDCETGPPVTAQSAVSRFSGSDLIAKPNGEVILTPRRRTPAAVTSGVSSTEVRELVGAQRGRRT